MPRNLIFVPLFASSAVALAVAATALEAKSGTKIRLRGIVPPRPGRSSSHWGFEFLCATQRTSF